MPDTDLSQAKRYDIGAGSFGNGLVVWNSAEERDRDYVKLAHIQHDRSVHYREPNLPDGVRSKIEHFAFTDDGRVSTTQPGRIFATPPLGEEAYALHTNGNHEQCRRPECTVTDNPPAATKSDVSGVISSEREERSATPRPKVATRFSIRVTGGWRRVYANTHIDHNALFVIRDGKPWYLRRDLVDVLIGAGSRADHRHP